MDLKPPPMIEFHVWVNNKYKGTIEAFSHSLAVKYAQDDYGYWSEIEVYRTRVDTEYRPSSEVQSEETRPQQKWNIHTGEGKHGIKRGESRWTGHIVTAPKQSTG